jgi:protein-S-isoprenylcysteine O-methyltransferase Ste14
MISIGNFFFKYRNSLFIFLYALLLVPSPELITEEVFGAGYWKIALWLGLFITTLGVVIRGITIGLTFIERGGNKELRIHADALITRGLFTHCRNPLYVGNNLMLLGLGILSNSLIYVLIVVPVFLFIYQCIIYAEEDFLTKKFGQSYLDYCSKVNRWLPNLKGIGKTFSSMKFNWAKCMLTENNTQIFWATGVFLTFIFKYSFIFGENPWTRHYLLITILPLFVVYYFVLRWLRKSGRISMD